MILSEGRNALPSSLVTPEREIRVVKMSKFMDEDVTRRVGEVREVPSFSVTVTVELGLPPTPPAG